MWPSHFKLETAIRSHILILPQYFTSTSDEFGSRSSILLDANENALGSPFSPSVDALQGSRNVLLSPASGIGSLERHPELDVACSPLISQDGRLPVIYKKSKRPRGECDSAALNKRRCYDVEDDVSLGMVSASTASSRETSIEPCNAAYSSPASSQMSMKTKLEDNVSQDILKALHRYPSVAQLDLKRRIAEWKGVADIRSICLGVGAAELIDSMIRLTCMPARDVILVTPPTFGLYHVRALLNDIHIVSCPLRIQNDDFVLSISDLLQKIAANPQIKLVFLASPGNPTGTLISLSAMRQILCCPEFHGILVVDEAYVDFSESGFTGSAMSLLPDFANLVVLHTTSKTLGLAGLRLGMAFGHPNVIQNLQKVQTPYCISTPTAAFALHALSPLFVERRQKALSALCANRARLVNDLTTLRLQGLDIGAPIGGGEANFVTLPVLARFEKGALWQRDNLRAKQVAERLHNEHAIAVRYVGDLHGCEGCIRVSVGAQWENAAFCEALRAILNDSK